MDPVLSYRKHNWIQLLLNRKIVSDLIGLSEKKIIGSSQMFRITYSKQVNYKDDYK